MDHMKNAPVQSGTIEATDSEARIIVLSAIYLHYRSESDPEITEFYLSSKVNDEDFAERTKATFMKIFGVESLAQLEEKYGSDCTTQTNIVDTVEDAHKRVSTKPLSFSSELFDEVKALVFEALAE